MPPLVPLIRVLPVRVPHLGPKIRNRAYQVGFEKPKGEKIGDMMIKTTAISCDKWKETKGRRGHFM
jgi:hypothetical protein